MKERTAVRNLDQIQEDDQDHESVRMPRGATLAFVGLGATCLVFAAMALGGRTNANPVAKTDPLADLAARGSHQASTNLAHAGDLSAKDVTFPALLSDKDSPTTALAAVKNAPGALAARDAIPPTVMDPANAPSLEQAPPATDRIPVMPLPAQNVLEASPIVTRPRDAVTREATEVARLSLSQPSSNDGQGQVRLAQSDSGHDGGYQLQVSSFHTQEEADAFAEQLRARGHKSHVAEAQVPGRGTWYRVRIGPFKDQRSAAAYRSSFETREHVVPFIVPPTRTVTNASADSE